MLYLISYITRRFESYGDSPFIDWVARLGETRELFEGCVLLNSAFTAVGIRRRLIGHIREDEILFITQVFQNHCAGKLTCGQKEFVRTHLCPDLFGPPPDRKPYSF